MSHEIEMTNGRANIAFTGQSPWHKMGQKIENAFDAETALKEANLDWEVEVAPLYYRKSWDRMDIQGYDEVESTKGKIVRRIDTGDELGVVGMKYSPLQNREAFAFFDGLFGEGNARFETAGFIGKGEKIWLLAKMSDNNPIEILPDDEISKYMLLTNSFDMSYAVIGAFTGIRVVCANTLNAAISSIENCVRIKHVGNVSDRLLFAGKILKAAGVYYDEMKVVFQQFAGKQLNTEGTRNYIENVLFPKKLKDNKRSKQRTTAVKAVEELVEGGRGSDIKGVRGTVWGTYNALVEYVDHVKEFRGGDIKRIAASQFGGGRDIKKRAYNIGCELVGANQGEAQKVAQN